MAMAASVAAFCQMHRAVPSVWNIEHLVCSYVWFMCFMFRQKET